MRVGFGPRGDRDGHRPALQFDQGACVRDRGRRVIHERRVQSEAHPVKDATVRENEGRAGVHVSHLRSQPSL